MHEGVIVAEKIAGVKGVHPLNTSNVPGCTYCWPQVASVGLTEAKAKETGRKIKVGKFPFIGNGKAIALGEAEGLVKTVFDAETGELLGAHMIGAEVTELIQGYVVAKTGELTDQELAHTIFPHRGRQVPLHRQRQGDRAGRSGGHDQDRVRCHHRRIAGRAHDRRRSHRTDPGLCHRQDRRADRCRSCRTPSSRIRPCRK